MAKIHGIENMTVGELRSLILQGGRFVIYEYCISILILTFKRGSAVYFIRPGENAVARGLPFTLLSLVAGWWGIPWGPIHTVGALVTNFKGGRDVTTEVVNAVTRSGGPA